MHLAFLLRMINKPIMPALAEASQAAWDKPQKLSREVSAEWKGPDAVEEIRQQREKP